MSVEIANCLTTVFEVLTLIALFVFLAGICISRWRSNAAAALRLVGWGMFIALWLWCIATMHLLWGWLPVVLGLILGIVTIVLVALIGFVIHSAWPLADDVAVSLALILLTLWASDRLEKHPAKD